MAEEFETGVIEIVNKYKPEIVFVETSGIAEPFPLYISMQNLGVNVEGVICVMDAKNYASYMHNATAKYQLGGSNIIVLNKSDLVSEEELSKAKQDIIAHKKENDITNTFTGKPIFNNFVVHTAEQGVVQREVFEGLYQVDEILNLKQEDYHKHHHDDIGRAMAYLSEDIAFDQVDQLISNLPKSLYRVKGIIKTTDVPNALIPNYSFGNVSYEELLEYDGVSMLVFIGEEMKEDFHALCQSNDFLSTSESCHAHHHDYNHEVSCEASV